MIRCLLPPLLLAGLGVVAWGQIPDQVACANAPVLVEGDNGYEQYRFTPATGINWTVFWRASLQPATTTTYVMRARRRLPREQLANPSFTDGVAGFRSSLPEATGGGFPAGRIAAVRRAGELAGEHADCPDLGGRRRDRFLAVHLAAGQEAEVVCQDVPVTAGQEYRFEFQVASLVALRQTRFQVRIDGGTRGGGVRSDASACTWRRFGRDYVAPRSGAVEVCLLAEAPAEQAVKSAVDSLSFRAYDVDLLDTFTVEVLEALPRRDTTVYVCGSGRFRLGDLDLGIGQIGDVSVRQANGCEEVVRYKVERARDDTIRSAATIYDYCVGDDLAVGGTNLTVTRDTVVRLVGRTRDGCDTVHVLTVDVLDETDLGVTTVPPGCRRGNGEIRVAPAEGVAASWDDGAVASTRGRLRAGDSLVVTATRAGCSRDFPLGFAPQQPGPRLEALIGPDCPGDPGLIRLEHRSEGELYLAPEGEEERRVGGNTLSLPAGAYDFVWRDPVGCDSTFSLVIPEPPPPAFVIDGPDVVPLGVAPVYRLVGPPFVPGALSWGFDGVPIDSSLLDELALAGWSPAGSGTLAAEYLDGKGCLVRLERSIALQRPERAFFASAFSPNEDGLHDGLRLQRHPGLVRLEDVAVYDRWGGRQFARPSVEPGDAVWDGAGHDAGVYVVYAAAVLRDGRRVRFATEITLLR